MCYCSEEKKRVPLAAVRYQDEIIWVPCGAWQCVWYVARVCQHFLYDEYIDDIDWPACSPGLNSTQHPRITPHPLPPQPKTDCAGADWCLNPGLGGDPPGLPSVIGRTEPHSDLSEFGSACGLIFFTLVFNINLNPVLSGLMSLGPHWLFLCAIVKELNISSIIVILFLKEIWDVWFRCSLLLLIKAVYNFACWTDEDTVSDCQTATFATRCSWPESSSSFPFTLHAGYSLLFYAWRLPRSPPPSIQWETRHSWHFAKVERQRTFVY